MIDIRWVRDNDCSYLVTLLLTHIIALALLRVYKMVSHLLDLGQVRVVPDILFSSSFLALIALGRKGGGGNEISY
jgi:hypothetical protein